VRRPATAWSSRLLAKLYWTVKSEFGAELRLDLPGPQNGVPDPAGTHLLVLARGLPGYRRLARVLSSAHLRGQEKGRPVYDLDEIVNELAGHALVLTGGRKGPVRLALEQDGPDAAAAELGSLVDRGIYSLDRLLRPAARAGVAPVPDWRSLPASTSTSTSSGAWSASVVCSCCSRSARSDEPLRSPSRVGPGRPG
jgi:hypothetical protein